MCFNSCPLPLVLSLSCAELGDTVTQIFSANLKICSPMLSVFLSSRIQGLSSSPFAFWGVPKPSTVREGCLLVESDT